MAIKLNLKLVPSHEVVPPLKVSAAASPQAQLDAHVKAAEAEIAKLRQQLDEIRLSPPIEPQVIQGSVTINDPNVPVLINQSNFTDNSSIQASSIGINNSTADFPTITTGNNLKLNTPGTVLVDNNEFNSSSTTNANVIMVTNANRIVLKNTTFTGVSYNTLMTGQNCDTFLDEFTIENCDFQETAKHFNFWFAGWNDNAVLNIKNTHFAKAEQTFCLSDYHAMNDLSLAGNKLTVNLEDVTIDEYQRDGDQWEGFIICDSRAFTGATKAEYRAAVPMGFSNVTINVKNVRVGGVLLTPENFIMGTAQAGQMLYYYINGIKVATGSWDNTTLLYSEDAALFPKVNFK